MTTTSQPSKGLRIALWSVQALLALTFVGTGIWKLATPIPSLAAKMREIPVNDFYNKNVAIRADGRVMHKTYLMRVKSPSESKYRGDYYQMLAQMSGEESFRPLAESECPLVKK